MAEAGEPAPPTLQMPSEQPDSPVSVPPVGPPPAMQLPLQPPAALQHPWGMQAAGGGMVQPGLMVGMGSQALPPQTQINPQAFLAQAPAPTGVPLPQPPLGGGAAPAAAAAGIHPWTASAARHAADAAARHAADAAAWHAADAIAAASAWCAAFAAAVKRATPPSGTAQWCPGTAQWCQPVAGQRCHRAGDDQGPGDGGAAECCASHQWRCCPEERQHRLQRSNRRRRPAFARWRGAGARQAPRCRQKGARTTKTGQQQRQQRLGRRGNSEQEEAKAPASKEAAEQQQ